MEVNAEKKLDRETVDNLIDDGYKLIGSYIVGVGTDPRALFSAAAGKLPENAVQAALFIGEVYYTLGVGFYRKPDINF